MLIVETCRDWEWSFQLQSHSNVFLSCDIKYLSYIFISHDRYQYTSAASNSHIDFFYLTLTSKFWRRSFRLCMVFPSCSMVSVESRGRSPMVFLLKSLRLDPWPLPLPSRGGESCAWASHRESLALSSFMVPCWLTIVSFCCKMVSRSWTMVFLNSSSWALALCTRLVADTGQLRSVPAGTAVQTKRLPFVTFARATCPLPSA